MFNHDDINFIDIRLLEGQIDLILRALELYAFNLHNTWGIEVDEDLQELRNATLFHTYHELLGKKLDSSYRIGYDVEENCRARRRGKRRVA